MATPESKPCNEMSCQMIVKNPFSGETHVPLEIHTREGDNKPALRVHCWLVVSKEITTANLCAFSWEPLTPELASERELPLPLMCPDHQYMRYIGKLGMEPDGHYRTCYYHLATYELVNPNDEMWFHENKNSINAEGLTAQGFDWFEFCKRQKPKLVRQLRIRQDAKHEYERATHLLTFTDLSLVQRLVEIKPTWQERAQASQGSSSAKSAQSDVKESGTKWASAIRKNRLRDAFASMQSDEPQPPTSPPPPSKLQPASLTSDMGAIRTKPYSSRKSSRVTAVYTKREKPEEAASANTTPNRQTTEPSDVHGGIDTNDKKLVGQVLRAVASESRQKAELVFGKLPAFEIPYLQHELRESSGSSGQHSTNEGQSRIDALLATLSDFKPDLKEDDQNLEVTNADKGEKVLGSEEEVPSNSNAAQSFKAALPTMENQQDENVTTADKGKGAVIPEEATLTNINTAQAVQATMSKSEGEQGSDTTSQHKGKTAVVPEGNVPPLGTTAGAADPGPAKGKSELARLIEETGARRMVDGPSLSQYHSRFTRGKFGRATQVESHMLPVKQPEAMPKLITQTRAAVDTAKEDIEQKEAEEKEKGGKEEGGR